MSTFAGVNRYFIRLAYKGTAYHGWQAQPHTAMTIQQQLNEKLSMLLREEVNCVGCGRTDAGVHARDYFAHFDAATSVLAGDADFVYHLNCVLPSDIAVKTIYAVPENAHARFDAELRTYEYHLLVGKDAFNAHQAWEIRNMPDLQAMNTAAGILQEYEDFAAFCKAGGNEKTTLCTIEQAYWMQHGTYVVFTISANRFLRNMVRAIVGTMLDVGRGKLSPEDMHRIIRSGSRSEAGASVPAHGLYLTEILYPEVLKVNNDE